jgi:ArsR family transcriptional regulator
MTQMAKLFKALADPNRLRIVNILSQESLCVCDLQSVLGLSQPFISRHLAYLRRVGLVRDRREGPRVCYSLALDSPTGQALRAFLREVLPLSETFQADLQEMARLIRFGQLRSAGLQIHSAPTGCGLPSKGDGAADDETRAA